MTGIAVEALSVDFAGEGGTVHALRDLSFELPAGRILGLVGESGSGKSTAAFALMGLLASNARVVSGSLRIGGDSFDLAVPGATARLRGRAMAMIFQDPLLSLNPVFTVGAHLAEVLRVRHPALPRSERHAMAAEALAKVGLSDPARRLKQFPHELSGGMRQRVVIAMALLAKPALLIADEPTTALDVTVEAQVMREICALRDAVGCSVLLITHSLGLVTRYCDDLAVLYAGERIETGSVRDVARRPGHPYTRMLLECEVPLDQPRAPDALANRFRVIPGDLPDPHQRPDGCIFQPRCDTAFEPCPHVVPPPFTVGEGASGRPHTARCLRLGESR